MGHSHDHAGHAHGPANYNKAFLIGIILNTAFVITEATYGVLSHSLALIADAGHNLSDVLALVLSWIASLLAKKEPSKRRTYGYRRSSILAALFNAIFLLVAIGAIAWEALQRFGDPAPVTGNTVIWVATVGIIINTFTALMFLSGSKGDINIRGAFLHMAADAGVSLGVVIAGFVILWTNWLWLDPVISLVIVLVIFISTWGLLKESFNLSLDAVPSGINYSLVKEYFDRIPSVINTHDLHIWGISTTENALTVHLIVSDSINRDELMKRCSADLHEKFNIDHATIQLESSLYDCPLAPDHVI
ncbi:cation diffusion facilitator family transporter [Paenibacillus sp. B01]|uniref:cation diffusion facilitator family transporter n=1 Tax=Paenibacillus sp. B01 TaxID=2660554 RepID=UPI00129A32D7|nr:cation diffusion facilitator family transporter [Paenibacillus sp. B01]QGG55045.1 cation diffusion facilitator family transporter [Paenibacillus sp. B01]